MLSNPFEKADVKEMRKRAEESELKRKKEIELADYCKEIADTFVKYFNNGDMERVGNYVNIRDIESIDNPKKKGIVYELPSTIFYTNVDDTTSVKFNITVVDEIKKQLPNNIEDIYIEYEIVQAIEPAFQSGYSIHRTIGVCCTPACIPIPFYKYAFRLTVKFTRIISFNDNS